jgi:hypothetical protein
MNGKEGIDQKHSSIVRRYSLTVEAEPMPEAGAGNVPCQLVLSEKNKFG